MKKTMYENYNADQLIAEMINLTNEAKTINKKKRETPIFRVITLFKLSEQLKEINKKADEIGKRIKVLELDNNKIRIVADNDEYKEYKR